MEMGDAIIDGESSAMATVSEGTAHCTITLNAPVASWQRRVLHVLLIEDDTQQQQLLKALFSVADHSYDGSHFTLTVAPSAAMAKEILNTPDLTNSFDLVMVDHQLPDMLGSELVRWIREHVEASTCVTMLSSSVDRRLMQECFTNGAAAFFVKPLRVSQIHKLGEVCRIYSAVGASRGGKQQQQPPAATPPGGELPAVRFNVTIEAYEAGSLDTSPVVGVEALSFGERHAGDTSASNEPLVIGKPVARVVGIATPERLRRAACNQQLVLDDDGEPIESVCRQQ